MKFTKEVLDILANSNAEVLGSIQLRHPQVVEWFREAQSLGAKAQMWWHRGWESRTCQFNSTTKAYRIVGWTPPSVKPEDLPWTFQQYSELVDPRITADLFPNHTLDWRNRMVELYDLHDEKLVQIATLEERKWYECTFNQDKPYDTRCYRINPLWRPPCLDSEPPVWTEELIAACKSNNKSLDELGPTSAVRHALNWGDQKGFSNMLIQHAGSTGWDIMAAVPRIGGVCVQGERIFRFDSYWNPPASPAPSTQEFFLGRVIPKDNYWYVWTPEGTARTLVGIHGHVKFDSFVHDDGSFRQTFDEKRIPKFVRFNT